MHINIKHVNIMNHCKNCDFQRPRKNTKVAHAKRVHEEFLYSVRNHILLKHVHLQIPFCCCLVATIRTGIFKTPST